MTIISLSTFLPTHRKEAHITVEIGGQEVAAFAVKVVGEDVQLLHWPPGKEYECGAPQEILRLSANDLLKSLQGAVSDVGKEE